MSSRPSWLKVRIPSGENFFEVRRILRSRKLNTICEDAMCPNIAECWGKHRTATFMILGDICTRACAFCAVTSGRPTEYDLAEPARVAAAIAELKLKHAVITSVDRDDLKDGGAMIFAIRFKSDYTTSFGLLKAAKEMNREIFIKTGIMIGLGEEKEEIVDVMHHAVEAGVDILTIGQYLRPSAKHAEIKKYYHPDEFAELREVGRQLGIRWVFSGPLVRSSYHAEDVFDQMMSAG